MNDDKHGNIMNGLSKKKKKKIITLSLLILIFGSLTVFSWNYIESEKIINENNSESNNSFEDSSNNSKKFIVNNNKISNQSNDSSIINEFEDSIKSIKKVFDNNIKDDNDIPSKIIKTKKIKNNNDEEIVDIYNFKDLEFKFLIIIGTFSSKENALNFRNLKSKNLNANCKVIFNNENLYWVILDFYNTIEEGKRALKEHKVDGWVKKF